MTRDPDAAKFVKELMETLPDALSTLVGPQQIPSVVSHLYGAKDVTWVVFTFRPPAAPLGEGAVNLQYSVEDGVVGMDWVLLGRRNVSDKTKIADFVRQEGFRVSEREMHGVRYLRTEGSGIEQLGIAVVASFYKLTDKHSLGVITDSFQPLVRDPTTSASETFFSRVISPISPAKSPAYPLRRSET